VLLIEDNLLLRERVATMLARQPDLRLVAALDDVDAALRRVQDTSPQIVLLAARHPDSHRLTLAVKKLGPETRIIVMDLLPMPEELFKFIQGGASGFIAKDVTPEHFLATVRSVAGGADVLPRALTSTLFCHIVRQGGSRTVFETSGAPQMTRRERQVVQLIMNGLSNKEIADRLHIATNTVKGHVHSVLKKIGAHTRLQVAAHVRGGDRPSQAV
jgi:DNA-binding NarL/FixJ family response regulator